MDGPTATRAIRALGYTGRIFGVTGNGMAGDVRLFATSGANRVILKPFTLADFQDALGERGTGTGEGVSSGAGAGARGTEVFS